VHYVCAAARSERNDQFDRSIGGPIGMSGRHAKHGGGKRGTQKQLLHRFLP
jgi:hypothetical protein